MISAGETCDGTAGCRPECTRCGDNVLDEGEDCDAGSANSDAVAGACPLNCDAVCGNARLEWGEPCDDGNDNPRDACDACRQQRWDVEVVVSGALEGRSARAVALLDPSGVAVDRLGRVYVADTSSHRIRRIDPDGTATTIAGSGVEGEAGDLGPATSAQLRFPGGVAVDSFGRVYVADTFNHRVRRIDIDGRISTVAGTGGHVLGRSDTEATRTTLADPFAVAIDAQGRLVIADTSNAVIRRVDDEGHIEVLVGNGQTGFSGDGGPAIEAMLTNPQGVAVGSDGRLYISDTGNGCVRVVTADGVIATIPELSADPNFTPRELALDIHHRLYVADQGSGRVLRWQENSVVATIAGTIDGSDGGDGGPAVSALLQQPQGVAVDVLGRVSVADTLAARIRRIETDGTIETIAGTGSGGFIGDRGPATSALLGSPGGIAVDGDGRVHVASSSSFRILRIEHDGTIKTIVGDGVYGSSGDGGQATAARVMSPAGLAFDATGQLLFVDPVAPGLRRVDSDGIIDTVVAADRVGRPEGLAIDSLRRIVIADTGGQRVVRIEVDGTVTTIAGTGMIGFSGDGGPAIEAMLAFPTAVAVDEAERILIADRFNGRVRRVETDGTITTIAGAGAEGTLAEGVPATVASLDPFGLALDAQGRLWVTDAANARVRRVETDGTIVTVAGNGVVGTTGDGGPAVLASFYAPRSLAVDRSGRVLIGDDGSCRVRLLALDGTVSTVLGPVNPPGPGPTATARLYPTSALVALPDQTLIGVGETARLQRINLAAQRVEVVAGYEDAASSAHGRASFSPLLHDAHAMVFDPVAVAIVVPQPAARLRVIGLDSDLDGTIDEPSRWTNTEVSTTHPVGTAGIAYDESSDTFLIVDAADHCVRRVGRDGRVSDDILGVCGTPGIFAGFLNEPTHVVISPRTGALYVADTGNHRVLRVIDGSAEVVVGDGSVSSAGEGSPARLFPVNAPRQLALDFWGNLYVASTTTVRFVANVDGDDEADGDDQVATIFGGGARAAFPESDAMCVGALALHDGDVFVADACQGFLVKIDPRVTGP